MTAIQRASAPQPAHPRKRAKNRTNLRWAPSLVQSVHSFQPPPPSMKASLWWHQVPAKRQQADVEFVGLLRPTFVHKEPSPDRPNEGISVFFGVASDALAESMAQKNRVVALRIRRETMDDEDDSDNSEIDFGAEDQWFTFAILDARKPMVNVRLHLPSGSYEFALELYENGERIEAEGTAAPEEGVFLSFVYETMTMKNV